MSFLNPMGLIGLVGIPIIIIIYILKNKYTEQIVTSTYLWTLSERFLKRRNPINKIAGLISLILQLLIVTVISFSIAQPIITLKGVATDYCFVLDGTGSMQIVQGEDTRFDIGKQKIEKCIKDSKSGSTYTLVYVGASTEKVFENLDNKDSAITLLNTITPSFASNEYTDALLYAQEYFNLNPTVETWLVTDKAFEQTENIVLKNVTEGYRGNKDNYAVNIVSAALVDQALKVEVDVVSYESDKTLSVELYFDGASEASYTAQAELVKGEVTHVVFECTEQSTYNSIRAFIPETDVLSLDNEAILYSKTPGSWGEVLVVSEKPTLIRNMLVAQGIPEQNVKVISPLKYDVNQKNYGLYIFDSFELDAIPEDGAVWFFAPKGELAGTGFTYQGSVFFGEDDLHPAAREAVLSKTTSPVYESVVDGIRNVSLPITGYSRCITEREFAVIMECNFEPVMFVGLNDYNNREAVFSFGLDNTDLAVKYDFAVLIKNLLNYTFPTIIEETYFYSGDTLVVNVRDDCETLRIDSPSGKSVYLNTNTDMIEFDLSEVGIYNIVMNTASSTEILSVYSNLPQAERVVSVTEGSFLVNGEKSDEKHDGFYDPLLVLFILAAVIFVADWMVYCYEQYQLR